MLEKILDLIFPRRCEICGKLGTSICSDCMKMLDRYKINSESKDKFFIYRYSGKIRNLILSYKYRDNGYLYDLFEKCIIKNKKACKFLKRYDIIIPVPIHKKRRLSRGYNQTELIARKLALDLNSLKAENGELCKHINYEPDVLVKTKNIKKQSKKNYKEREESSKGVYFAKNTDKIKGKRVVIFDDVYTTGSTYQECRKALLKNGASKVRNINSGKRTIKPRRKNGRFSRKYIRLRKS